MTDASDRFRRIAAAFDARVHAVAPDAWDAPAPCEGWVARDVVGHLVGWMPFFLERFSGVTLPAGPAVAVDPVGAWDALRDGLQGVLDDPGRAALPCFVEPANRHCTVAEAINDFMTTDVFLHTWDLARAAGLDEKLDPDEVHHTLVGMEPLDAVLRGSGHYGPRVAVPEDASEQDRLLAFIGRHP
jgi:uncharacterized protein (TIGR03086 family)